MHFRVARAFRSGYAGTMNYYHVTEARNLASILRTGLVPTIGPRSQACGETTARTYLFHTRDDMENALSNWLGEYFEDVQVAILQVETDNAIPVDAEYEVVCLETISPDKIHLERIE